MNALMKTLSATPLFGGLAEQQLAPIARIGVEKAFSRGQTVFSEGQSADGFYVVATGKVKVFKVSAEGKEQILHIFGPGHPFGEVPVFTGRRFPASAEALAASRLVFFPRSAFVDLIGANPSLALNMLGLLAMRLREFTVQIENLSLKEVPGRLASYLVVLAGEQGDGRSVDLPISKGQLASLLGTIPETLSRIFARMVEQGLITVDGRRIGLRNSEGLEELAVSGKLGAGG